MIEIPGPGGLSSEKIYAASRESCTDIIFRPKTVSKFRSDSRLANVGIGDKVIIKCRVSKKKFYDGEGIVEKRDKGQLLVK